MNKEKREFYLDVVMIVLALVTIFLLFYEMTIAVSPANVEKVRSQINFIHTLDFWICVVFMAEFVYGWWTVKDRKAYIKTRWLEVPGMIPFTIIGGSALFRLFRLFRLVRVFSLMKRFSRLYSKRFVRNEVQYIAVVLICIILSASYGVFFFERTTNFQFRNIGDAVWWTFVTISGVGYGDIVPITPMGKAIAVILMFTGIGLIGVISGTMASYLLRSYRGEKEKEDVEEALRILKLRRAKGEVTEHQYLEIRKDLEDMMHKK